MEPAQKPSSVSADAKSDDFDALVRPWVDEMYRAAAAIVGRAYAEDVTQHALLDAWRGFARLRDRERVRPWLHSIVANRASKFLRSARSRPKSIAVDPEIAMDHAGSAPDSQMFLAERDQLDRAFDRLTADQRVCLVLRYTVDLSVPQIAAALGLPEGTVKSRLNAAVERLRLILAEDER